MFLYYVVHVDIPIEAVNEGTTHIILTHISLSAVIFRQFMINSIYVYLMKNQTYYTQNTKIGSHIFSLALTNIYVDFSKNVNRDIIFHSCDLHRF